MQERQLVKPVLNPPPNVTKIVDASGLALLTDFFNRCNFILGWDAETTPVKDFYWRRLRTIQFGNQTEQYVIDLLAFCDNDSDLLYKSLGEYGKHLTPNLQIVVDTIAPIVTSSKYLKVGVNLSFEYECFYWQLGVRTLGFWDCALVEKCIYAGAHSMKDYAFYSMAAMMGRYFGYEIDKELQESFTLECDLTHEQLVYATLDTRYPLAIRQVQLLILKGETLASLRKKGSKAASFFEHIDPVVTGDNLEEIAAIENDAIGAFVDMHLHGERIDKERWRARTDEKVTALKTLISDVLDPFFIPIVGTKSQVITDEDIAAADAKWKAFNKIPDEELSLTKQIRYALKMDGLAAPPLIERLKALETARKTEKEIHKKAASELGKRRTRIKNLVAKCEGQALINYGSDSQLLAVIQPLYKRLAKVTGLDDDTLEKYQDISVMAAIREYHGLKKFIGTYGYSWATEWTTHPCKEEGWLHPGDGRLHCTFNQYDAETGRSSSEKPNGQNLPQDKDVRSCFTADPPNEDIRISTCCNASTWVDWSCCDSISIAWRCSACKQSCDTKAEEYVIVTADMSGAELRIIAELAQDPIWIGAFQRGEDVHSVGTEILYEQEWPALQLPDCAYFKLNAKGEPQRHKCKCPGHGELRNGTKSANFLLAYGGGPGKLALQIKKSVQAARDLMALHASKFPRIWAYLDASGLAARTLKKSFDMFGRRRLFPEPTRERAREWFISENAEKLKLDEEACEQNILSFTTIKGREPDKEERFLLTHRQPTDKEVNKSMMGLSASIGRQGKNHAIQGTNASIAKVAMGSGYCKDGKPFLWHTLPQYRAKLIKFVHDELVVQSPKQHGEQVAALIGDAFKRAAAQKMKLVDMEFDYKVSRTWEK